MKILTLTPETFLKGISSSAYSLNGFFAHGYMYGIDLFKDKLTYGLIQQGYGYTDLTGDPAIIKDTIKYFVQKDLNAYGFGDDGRLYKFDAIGTPVWAPTELDSANYAARAGGKGLAIYHDGTSEKLHYFANTTIGLHDFSTSFNNSYKTGLENAPHPAKEFQGELFFGNGKYVGKLTGSTLKLDALTLPIGYQIQDIEVFNGYLVILANRTIGVVNTECRLFFWDSYNTTGWNYEYLCPEKCTALEIYKNDLALFGRNVRLFGGGAFDVICEMTLGNVYPGQTAYTNNMLCWQENGAIFTYGTKNSFIPPVLQAPLYNAGVEGAILSISSSANQFLVSKNTDRAGVYNSGYSGGFGDTVKIPFDTPSKIRKINFLTEILSANAGIDILLYNDKGTVILSKTLSHTNDGTKSFKSYQVNSNYSTNYFYLVLNYANFTSGDLKIKKITIEYDPAE